ncbi:hypothetical protein [Curtobacterium sp. RRHDQ10]|uniref:hypothetical protein n=1 Tax=Curtobacterium phyllosphaerae TaxID=3413379 RepID=UPI003BF3D25E
MSMTISTTELTLDTDTVDTIAILEAEAALQSGAERASRAQIVWTEADAGLWVASYGGYYGGTVDKQNGHYFASDTFGQYVGDFASLELAQQRLGAHLHLMLPGVIRPAR